MCVEIETYTTCNMHEMCVFREFSEKKSKSQNLCWHFHDNFLSIQKCVVFSFLKDSAKYHNNI